MTNSVGHFNPSAPEALRAHLDEGAKQAKRGEFVELDVGDVIARAKKRAKR